MSAAMRCLAAMTVVLVLNGPASPPSVRGEAPAAIWRQLEPGLELARFSTADTAAHPAGDLVVLRVDPTRWSLRLLRAADLNESRARTAREWCEDFGLAAAINAGMYQADRRTHVGFVQYEGRVLNPHPNSYLSALAFEPRSPRHPPLRIYDLDVASLDSIAAAYAGVIQNLRLVKRPRESRWRRRDRAWREAALGEDSAGRALLIYCHTALTMPDFNALLLELPLDLQVAQHLEGGAQAQLHVAHPAAGRDSLAGDQRRFLWSIPNVLGVVRRSEPLTADADTLRPRSAR